MPAPPPATRRDDLVERLHGHTVADPYRWLEAPASDPDVREFVRVQHDAAEAHLAALPHRAAFRDRLRALWDHPRQGVPWRRGETWFQLRNDGLQDQDVVWTAAAGTGSAAPATGWRVLLDPATWSEDGTAALSGFVARDDGRLAAFGRSEAGSDWVRWHVVDTATGALLPDTVTWSKFAPVAWLPDGNAFVYTAYDPPEPGEEHAAAVRDQRLMLHRLGTSADDDVLVHARPDQPEWGVTPHVTHDGAWLLLTIHRGTDPESRVHIAPITRDAGGAATIGPVRALLDDGDAAYEPLGVRAGELLVLTDHDAPLGRIVVVDLEVPHRRREVVAAGTHRLEGADLIGGAEATDPGWLVCRWLRHAAAEVTVHDPGTGVRSEVLALPDPVTVTRTSGSRFDDAVHLAVESFSAPSRILRHDLTTSTLHELPPAAGVAPGSGARTAAIPDDLVVEQVHVHHAGVAVPLFVVHRADVTPDARRPTVLWGYGGFGIPITPLYRPGWRAWVDAGGVLAVACLRGGGEYGRAWHDDGRLVNKQHVFDDALACAAWLTGRRTGEVTATPILPGSRPDVVWSSPPHLGVEGRSNGGLLAAACLTQAPEAFGTAVPEVGVLDLARFHRFTIGWAWTSDYGSPDDAEDLGVLLGYSPYHRIVEGTAYPATLVTTGDTDDRVVPAHSYKFSAALQHAQGGDAPVLLRVERSAGHGAGKPVGKALEERADVLAFHADHLGMPPLATSASPGTAAAGTAEAGTAEADTSSA